MIKKKYIYNKYKQNQSLHITK